MNNEVVKQQIPIGEIMTIGKAFVESGMFPDVKTAAQAVVKIQAGQEIGIAPFASMSGIHIIQGRPTLGAGVIASKIKGSGKYDYRIKINDEKICSIDFFQGKDMIGNSSFTIEDARKAQTKNLDKFPRNMLFARAISNGVKWFCPDVFSGPVYTPEEMEQVTEDVPHEEKKVREGKKEAKIADFNNVPEQSELQNLRQLVFSSTLDESKKEAALGAIEKCTSYKVFEQIKYRLEDLQPSIDTAVNPSQKEINTHLKKAM